MKGPTEETTQDAVQPEQPAGQMEPVERGVLRAALLKGAPRKHLVIKTPAGPVTVVQATVAERQAILQAGGTGQVEKKGKQVQPSKSKIGEMQVAAIITCAYDRLGGQRLFEVTDRDALLALPTGGWLDDVADAALSLMNDEPEDAAGKS